MDETSFSFSRLESPSPDAVLAPGEHVLRGWVWPKPGGHFVDVRARVGERIFPAVHGFPRADLAAHFRIPQPFALAEFAVVVELLPNQPDVLLEVLEIEGRWSPFGRVRFALDPSAAPVRVRQPGGPLRWHELGRALQVLLRLQGREPSTPLAELARRVVASIPYPRDLRHPHPPFRGHLDEPAAVTRCGFGRTAVLGYLFHETQPIRRVFATFDLQAWQTVEHGRPSPGPAAYYPQFATAAACGLYGIIDTPAQLPSPAAVRVYAELGDGSIHLCSVQRSLLFTHEDEKAPYPPRDGADFSSARDALREALDRRGVEIVEDEDWRREQTRIEADFALRAPGSRPAPAPLRPAPTRARRLPRRALLVTHNLNFEGAPLFLLDYARHLAAKGVALAVVSPSDGPLRADFAAAGARLQLVNVDPVLFASGAAAARAAIAAATEAVAFSEYDLVVCNTFTTFWAVQAARAAGRPVLLYVHESTTPATFYLGRVEPEVVALVDEAFGLADAVAFTTESTRSYHIGYGRPDRHWLAPGWVDVGRIDSWRAAHPRAGLRERFGLGPEELLVTNVGTVCDRKGQHIFARAVDLLWRRHPALAERTRFVMLGGGKTPFDETLADLLAQLGRANLEVHPSTADYLPYYAAADLVVCSTYEESSPRVILEAMACVAPLLSSRVHGVPEQVRPDLEATLIPPGDTAALCEGMVRLLLAPTVGRALAQRARARVVQEFDAGVLLDRHAALAGTVAGDR